MENLSAVAYDFFDAGKELKAAMVRAPDSDIRSTCQNANDLFIEINSNFSVKRELP